MPLSIETPTAVVQSLAMAQRLTFSASSTTRSVRGSPAGRSAFNRDLSLTKKMLMLDHLFNGFLQSNQVGEFELRKWSVGKQIKKVPTDGAPIVWNGTGLTAVGGGILGGTLTRESASPLRYSYKAPVEIPTNPTSAELEVFGTLNGANGSVKTEFLIVNHAGWKGFIGYAYAKSVVTNNSRPTTTACFPYILCTYDSIAYSFNSGSGAIAVSADIAPGTSPATVVFDINSWEGSFNLGDGETTSQTAKRGPDGNGKEGCLETSGEDNSTFMRGKANAKPITQTLLFFHPDNSYEIFWSPPSGAGSGFETRKSYSTDCIQKPFRQATRQPRSNMVSATTVLPTSIVGKIDPDNPDKLEGLSNEMRLDASGQPVKVFVYWSFVKTRF
jgi:hypothetical protein